MCDVGSLEVKEKAGPLDHELDRLNMKTITDSPYRAYISTNLTAFIKIRFFGIGTGGEGTPPQELRSPVRHSSSTRLSR